MSERDEPRGWLRPLEPPPGGVDGLRRRLARHARRRKATRRASAGLVAVLVLAVGALTLREHRSRRPLPEWATSDLLAVELGLVRAPTEPVSVPPEARGRVAVRRVPTGDARVALYLVGRRE